MKFVNNILKLIIIIFLFSSCHSTKNIFIEFKKNSKGKCYYDPMYNDGRNKKLTEYKYINNFNKDGLNEFEICNTFFEEIEKTEQKISRRKYDKLNIISIDSLLRLQEEFTKKLEINFVKEKKTKHKVFKNYDFNIFIIEKENDSIVNLYKVKILDKSYKNHEKKNCIILK